MNDTLIIKIYITIIAFILGAVMGSFLNCMAIRIGTGEKAGGRSHCMSCGHPLGIPDLVPIFSWLFLKGRCRYCKEKISPKYFVAELVFAVVYASITFSYGPNLDTLRYIIMLSLLFIAMICDLETMTIPDRFCITGATTWAVLFIFDGNGTLIRTDIGSGILQAALGSIAIPLALFLISLLLSLIIHKDTLGFGDIKLLFMAGLYLGLSKSILNILIM